jgi:hypothetical protein
LAAVTTPAPPVERITLVRGCFISALVASKVGVLNALNNVSGASTKRDERVYSIQAWGTGAEEAAELGSS